MCNNIKIDQWLIKCFFNILDLICVKVGLFLIHLLAYLEITFKILWLKPKIFKISEIYVFWKKYCTKC